jgi:hypothetical protein
MGVGECQNMVNKNFLPMVRHHEHGVFLLLGRFFKYGSLSQCGESKNKFCHQRKCRLWVNNRLYRQPCHRSAYPREADANDANADRPVGMSAVRGKADVACQGLSGPFLANSGRKVGPVGLSFG